MSARLTKAAAAMTQQQQQQLGDATDDEEYIPAPLRGNVKRKRHEAEGHGTHASTSTSTASSAEGASSSSPSSSSSSFFTPTSFPCLSDVEPRVDLASFLPVSHYSFSLMDESRDRGSAKLCIVHVRLSHPAFALAASSSSSRHASSSSSSSPSPPSLHYTTSMKIDGRKSFSNAPFKRYYTRGIHAAWFASGTKDTQATNPPLNAVCPTPTHGRVLFVLSQRNGRPQGKAFTGLLHDTSSYSSKHPLLCLSSNSVEYDLRVYVNRASLPEEVDTSDVQWSEVQVEVSARFDAGAVTLDPVPMSAGAAAACAAASHSIVRPQAKQARTTLPHVSSVSSMPPSSPTMSRASSSSSSSLCSSADATASAASVAASSSAPSPAPSDASASSSSSSSAFLCASAYSPSRTLDSPVPFSSSSEEEEADGYDSCTPLHFLAADHDHDSHAQHAQQQLSEPLFALGYDDLMSEGDQWDMSSPASMSMPPAPPSSSSDLKACRPSCSSELMHADHSAEQWHVELTQSAAVADPKPEPTAVPVPGLELPPMGRGVSQPFTFTLRPDASPTLHPRPMPAHLAWPAQLAMHMADLPALQLNAPACSPLPSSDMLAAF